VTPVVIITIVASVWIVGVLLLHGDVRRLYPIMEYPVTQTMIANQADVKWTVLVGNVWTLENLAIPAVLITTANQDDARVTRYSFSV